MNYIRKVLQLLSGGAVASSLLIAVMAKPVSAISLNDMQGMVNDNRLSGLAVNNSSFSIGNLGIKLQLHVALAGHAALAGPTFQAALSQDPSLPTLQGLVEENNEAIASSIDKMYPGIYNSFLSLWRTHINYYMDYLNASAQGDITGKMLAKQHLAIFADQLSNWLVQQNSNYDQATLQQMISMHGDQTLQIIDELVAGDQMDALITSGQTIEHMEAFADYLTQFQG